MLREEILRLFLRVTEALLDDSKEHALELRAELKKRLAELPYVERLGVPFDI